MVSVFCMVSVGSALEVECKWFVFDVDGELPTFQETLKVPDGQKHSHQLSAKDLDFKYA